MIYIASIRIFARSLAAEALDLTRRQAARLATSPTGAARWRPDETDTTDGGRRASGGEVDMTLPTFIVIGVAKAGTTSLYRYFDQHPDVFMYPEKGTNYFGYEDARDWKWADEGEPPLLRHFRVESFEEYEAAFAGSSGETAVGEVSPQYFRSPTAAERMHARLPDVQVIVPLRNPARARLLGLFDAHSQG